QAQHGTQPLPIQPSSDAFWSVTLHTTLGDIKIEVFCEAVPKTAENFLALCAPGYYDGCISHRNIKGFMIQTVIPLAQGRADRASGDSHSRTRSDQRSSSTTAASSPCQCRTRRK
ncbi:cyclophilin-like protein, partial [Laetiporus sulphureus 93-53]